MPYEQNDQEPSGAARKRKREGAPVTQKNRGASGANAVAPSLRPHNNGKRRRGELQEPPIGYILERAQEREARLGGFASLATQDGEIPQTYDGLVRAVRDRRRLKAKPWTPAAYKLTAKDIRAGQALMADMITRVASTLTAGERRIQVIPSSNRAEEDKRTTLIRRWLTAVLLGENGRPGRLQQEAGEPWFELGIDQVVGDGRCIWEMQPREVAYSELYGAPSVDDYDDLEAYVAAAEKFEEERAPFPFKTRRVDPLSYDEWRVDGKAIEAIKIEDRPVREVYPFYGLRRDDYSREEGFEIALDEPYPPYELPPEGRSLNRLARCLTYWYADPIPDENGACRIGWCYLVDGQKVDGGQTIGPYFHPLPFFLFHGLHTSLPDAHMKGVSLAFLILRIADAIDALMSMKFNVGVWSSLPAWKLTKPSNGVFDLQTGAVGAAVSAGQKNAGQPTISQGSRFTLTPGEGYVLNPGEDILAIDFPQAATLILDSLKNDLMELIGMIGLPSAMRGVSPGAGAPGYLAAQLIAQARTALAPALNNAADALTEMARWLLWQVEHRFKDGVPVWSAGDKHTKSGVLRLRPKDIGGRYDLQVMLEPLLPVDKIQQSEASLKQVAAGAISMRRHREEGLQIDSPEEEEEIIEAEAARQHPVVALPRRVAIAVRLGYISPQEGNAILQKELGIAPPPAPTLLGPDGAPIQAAPGAPGGVIGVPAVPGAAPVNAVDPLARTIIEGGANAPAPTIQPDRAAQAVGGAA